MILSGYLLGDLLGISQCYTCSWTVDLLFTTPFASPYSCRLKMLVCYCKKILWFYDQMHIHKTIRSDWIHCKQTIKNPINKSVHGACSHETKREAKMLVNFLFSSTAPKSCASSTEQRKNGSPIMRTPCLVDQHHGLLDNYNTISIQTTHPPCYLYCCIHSTRHATFQTSTHSRSCFLFSPSLNSSAT